MAVEAIGLGSNKADRVAGSVNGHPSLGHSGEKAMNTEIAKTRP
jgi:hypothetical protein